MIGEGVVGAASCPHRRSSSLVSVSVADSSLHTSAYCAPAVSPVKVLLVIIVKCTCMFKNKTLTEKLRMFVWQMS